MSWFISTAAGKMLLTTLFAMVPVAELRAAIPFGVAMGLKLHTSLMCSIIGNLIPTPFIIIYVERIFHWLRRVNRKLDALVTKLENRANLKSDAVTKYGFIGLCVLVAIPLPGTGAWTGSLVAALMDIPLKKAMPAVILGVLIAGVIVSCLTFGVVSLF